MDVGCRCAKVEYGADLIHHVALGDGTEANAHAGLGEMEAVGFGIQAEPPPIHELDGFGDVFFFGQNRFFGFEVPKTGHSRKGHVESPV